MKTWRSVLLVAVVAVVGCHPGRAGPRMPRPTVPDDDFGPAPAFTLTERDGKTVTDADLRGKVWIASFVFTRCTGPCPQVTGTMARLQSELADVSDLRLVTFTVDPERDDPKELTRYAENYRADPERWLFVTGKEQEVHALVRQGFKLYVERKANARPGDEIGHDQRLVLVDKNGHIRGYFDGIVQSIGNDPPREFEDNLSRLREKARGLALEGP